jgi:hypothetical protein
MSADLWDCLAGGAIMTTLKPETFKEIGDVGNRRVQALLKIVRQALTTVAFGPFAVDDRCVVYHPIRPLSKLAQLNEKRDRIQHNYRQIWDSLTLEYDMDQPGAEIFIQDKRMFVGPFMLDYVNPIDLEKVIIHEYLHAVLEVFYQTRGLNTQHDQIDLIIREGLKYKGPPNPADPSRSWNQPL